MGRFRGGLAMAAVLACAAFGAICGSSVATAATITSVALPEMRRHGYSGRLATGTLAAGGTLGILIPPSVPLVIYAILAEQNIAKLFAAAMVPGLIAMLGYMIAIAIYVRAGARPGARARRSAAPITLQRAVPASLPIAVIFLIVFGGIYGGKFTPTEGAAVGAAATFVAALAQARDHLAEVQALLLRHRRSLGDDLHDLPRRRPDELGAGADPGARAAGQRGAAAGACRRWRWSVAILLFYVVLGAVMDELSMILLTIPIFFPMIMGLDFGMPKESVAIWFGIMVLMTVGFGLLAPPVGLNVYVVNGMAKDVPIAESYRGVMPFLISDTLRTLLLLFFPPISLWLVKYHRLSGKSGSTGRVPEAVNVRRSSDSSQETLDETSFPAPRRRRRCARRARTCRAWRSRASR